VTNRIGCWYYSKHGCRMPEQRVDIPSEIVLYVCHCVVLQSSEVVLRLLRAASVSQGEDAESKLPQK
jgi:hypothetical protein